MKLEKHEIPEQPDEEERGSALIITMIVLMILMSLGVAMLKNGAMQSQSTLESRFRAIAIAECEAGIALALRQVETEAGNAPNAFLNMETANGRALVSANGTTQVYITDDAANKIVQVEAQFESARPVAWGDGGAPKTFKYRIQAYLASQNHPAFYKAIYVGNKHGFANQMNLGPIDGQSTTHTWDESAFVDENTRLNEATLGIDFNGDGDMTDEPKISEISSMTGWAAHMENSGSTWRIDLDQDGDYAETYSNTLAYEFAAPDGSETPDASWESTHEKNGDYVEGDVYVNGDVALRNDTLMWGDIDAVGQVNGAPVTGTVTENADQITPPDLHGQNYASIADETITPGTVDGSRFYGASSNGSFYSTATGTQDNGIVHLGPNSGGQNASFTNADDGKLIFVQGNLWLHTSGGKYINLPNGTKVVMTIVVEGNMYIGDDLQYQHPNTGVLFLVKGKTDDTSTTEREDESFVDANKNYTYDAGEQLINDDGDGVYEGPHEGQGNVYFMDVYYGTGGVTDGFMYAENNAYVAPPLITSAFTRAEDKIYGVKGFLSAGGIFSLADRSKGTNYINYKVKYDNRIEDGTFSFKGIPTNQGGSYKGLKVTSWRVVPPL